MTRALRWFGLAVALTSAACGRSTPTSPSTPTASLAGVWTGTLTSGGSDVAVRLDLQGRADGESEFLSGRYELRDASVTTTGAVAGFQLRGTASITLTPPGPPRCPASLADLPSTLAAGLQLGGARLTGTATWLHCGNLTTAVVALTKS